MPGKKKLKRYEWDYHVERTYVPLSASMTIFCTSKKHLDIFLPVKVGDYNLYYNHFIFGPRGTLEVFARAQLNEYEKVGPAFLRKMASLCRKEGDALLNFSKKFNKLKLENMTNTAMASHFKRFAEANHRFSAFIYYPISLQKFLTEQIDEIVSNCVAVTGKAASEIKAELLEPIEANESQKESESFRKILDTFLSFARTTLFNNQSAADMLKIIETKNKKLYKRINNHVSNFSWLGMRWFSGKPTTALDVVDRAMHFVKDPTARVPEAGDYAKIKRQTEKYIAEYEIKKSQAELIYLTKEYVFLRTFRTDLINKCLFFALSFLRESARRLGFEMEDIIMLSSDELVKSLIEKNVSSDVDFSKRKRSWLLFREVDKLTVFQGDEADSFAEYQELLNLIPKLKKEISGVSAFKGTSKGLVKVVRTTDDISKVNKGDILVAVMTFPPFGPAMEKASAFVTDEGGILCHASVIAREMKKPCIIGTKIATKVLKDGDLVEVDADKGIVKIIKKA